MHGCIMNDEPTFFHFQERALSVLWRWGLASVVLGLPALIARNPALRQIGIQSIAWGAINTALAFFGRRGARERMERGAPDAPAQARRFRLIALANVGLDIGYIAGGWRLVRGARGRGQRVGMGLGIIIQGLFLLMFDSALVWLVGRWTGELPQDRLE
jgi:hypothetical protein